MDDGLPACRFVGGQDRSWGKIGGKELRCSKSGAAHLEAAYAIHYVRGPAQAREL